MMYAIVISFVVGGLSLSFVENHFKFNVFGGAYVKAEEVKNYIEEKAHELVGAVKSDTSAVQSNRNVCPSIAAKVWSFIFDFVQDQLVASLSANQTKQWETVRQKMLGVVGFVEQRRKETNALIGQKQKGGFTVVDCPLCLETAFHLDHQIHECLFCRYTDILREVFDAWMTTFYGSDWTDPKERMISDPVDHCPFCGENYYVQMPDEGSSTPPDPAFVCFNCGFSKPPTVECSNCGREFTPDDWETYPFVCDECEADNQARSVE